MPGISGPPCPCRHRTGRHRPRRPARRAVFEHCVHVSCTIASITSSPSTTGRPRPPACAPPQRFPPRRTGDATDGQISAWTRTDERPRRSKHRPRPTTTPWPAAHPEPAPCANEQAAPAQPAARPSSPQPQPQPPSTPHYNRSLLKRHTARSTASAVLLRNATPSVFHQRDLGRVLRSSCYTRGRRLASPRGREPRPGRCASLWPSDLRDDGGSLAAAGAAGSET